MIANKRNLFFSIVFLPFAGKVQALHVSCCSFMVELCLLLQACSCL